MGWGAGGGWNDATEGVFTGDWLEVSFPSAKTVDEVNVFTLQDSFSSPADPTEALTFSLYGLTSFEVQAWVNGSWVTQGGSVSANNKVWRRVTFPAVTTSKVRVRALGAADGYSRVVELEAWGPTSTGGGAQVRWLVTDQLGTPRMVVDETGGLAGVSRHDYFPFGEELGAGVGGRTDTQGYKADTVRQKFTSYERDDETGLDYAQARYYANAQGRFTSTDPIYIELGRLNDPQQLNIYAYARNSPLVYIDPNGLSVTVVDKTTDGKGDDEFKRLINSRGGKFSVDYNDKGTLVIVDANGNALGKDALKALGKSLSGSEKELFGAITDTKNHATIDLVRQDGNVDFGRYDGNGKNTLDLGDLDVLSKSGDVGFTPYQVAGHETLEAYASATGKKQGESHDFANKFFPGLGPTSSTSYGHDGELIHTVINEVPLHNSNRSVMVRKDLVTPIPFKQTQNGISPIGSTRPAHITKVE